MISRGYGIIGHGDFAIGTYEHRFTARSTGIGHIHAIGFGHGQIRVTEQIVRKIEFFLKRFVVTGRIYADPHDDGILGCEVLDSITEPVAFDGSARGVGFRIPPEKHVFAGKIVQRHGGSILVGSRKCRRLSTNFYQGHGRVHPRSVTSELTAKGTIAVVVETRPGTDTIRHYRAWPTIVRLMTKKKTL